MSMKDTYTPQGLTKLRALDRMKVRARSWARVDPADSRHRDYMQAMLDARTAYEEQNVSVRMVANILEELLVLQQRA